MSDWMYLLPQKKPFILYLNSSSPELLDTHFQVPYGWNAGVLFNLAVLGPCYVILYYSHESPLFVQSKGNRTLALSLAAKCGMTIEVQSVLYFGFMHFGFMHFGFMHFEFMHFFLFCGRINLFAVTDEN